MAVVSGEIVGPMVEYEQMPKFDDFEYLESLINFIVGQSDMPDSKKYEAELWREYNKRAFGVLADKLQGLYEEAGSIEALYKMKGCPKKLYQFHKTARETSSYSGAKIEGVNPFYHVETWLSPDPRTKYKHFRNGETDPYVIAMPVEELIAALEQDESNTLFQPQKVNMRDVDLRLKLPLMESSEHYRTEQSDGRELNEKILQKINGYIEEGLLDP